MTDYSHSEEALKAQELRTEYATAYFADFMEGIATEHAAPSPNGSHFAYQKVNDERYPDLEVAVQWTAPERRTDQEDKTHVGSVFFTSQTFEQRDVLEYSLHETEDGMSLGRRAVSYTGQVAIDQLASPQSLPEWRGMYVSPTLTDNEVMEVTQFVGDVMSPAASLLEAGIAGYEHTSTTAIIGASAVEATIAGAGFDAISSSMGAGVAGLGAETGGFDAGASASGESSGADD
jgi:hypothetical protein